MVLAGNAARSNNYTYEEEVVIERHQSQQGYMHTPIRQCIPLTLHTLRNVSNIASLRHIPQ